MAAVTFKAQRSTLHSFWNIASQPTTAPDLMQLDLPSTRTISLINDLRCEDCDAALANRDPRYMDEELLRLESACWDCRRCVCDICSIQPNIRLCLHCAAGR